MEDDAQRVTPPGAETTDTVPQVDPIVAPGPSHGTIVHGKSDRIALAQRHDLGAALHARSLLGQHELAPREILSRFREKDRQLKRKGEIAVKILVQAIEVAGTVFEQQRRWPGLSFIVALLEEPGMCRRVAPIDAHAGVPFVRDNSQVRIERRAQVADQVRQRVFKIAILSLTETMTRHDHTAAEMIFARVEAGDPLALLARQELLKHRAAVAAQLLRQLRPVIAGDADLCGR